MLSAWSWGHQGVYLDTDGTLLSSASLPAAIQPAVLGLGWSLGPGATWHSGVDNNMLDPSECIYARDPSLPTSNNGIICTPALTFR